MRDLVVAFKQGFNKEAQDLSEIIEDDEDSDETKDVTEEIDKLINNTLSFGEDDEKGLDVGSIDGGDDVDSESVFEEGDMKVD